MMNPTLNPTQPSNPTTQYEVHLKNQPHYESIEDAKISQVASGDASRQKHQGAWDHQIDDESGCRIRFYDFLMVNHRT